MSAPRFRRVVDVLDGYSPNDPIPMHELPGDKLAIIQNQDGKWGNLARFDRAMHAIMDGYQNRLTGVGDPARDKTYGGRWNGPEFFNQFLTGWEAQERWRGSDLGGRIVETIPREMTRAGWTISIQPDEEDSGIKTDSKGRARLPLKTWSKSTKGRLDDIPAEMGQPPQEAAKVPGAVASSQHTPGELPDISDANTELLEALTKEQERLGLGSALLEALCYEVNYGGGAVFIGVDDGETNLTKPLDWKKVRKITHLTPFQGGWDGELIGWSYYCDMRNPKFGRPRTYQLRNLGVTVSLPTPGEDPTAVPEYGKAGTLITYIHESRFLIFPGQTISHWARVQMRGWGDAIWMRINQVLSQFDQSWNGIAILLSELGMPVLSMEGLSDMMADTDEEGMEIIQGRAMAMQMAMSIAKTRIIDTKETLERVKLDLGGVSDVLQKFALRLSAASSIPASRLLNEGKGGLGDTGKGDADIFETEVTGRQAEKLLPVLKRFTLLQLAASEGVSGGRIPKRWSVTMNPLHEMTETELADLRYKTTQADQIEYDKGVITPEEGASTRYGGSSYNAGPIVLDLEGRRAMAQKEAAEPEPDLTPPPEEPPAGGGAPPAAPLPGQPPANEPATPPLAVVHDAADFFTKNGRTRVRTAVCKIAVFNGDGKMLFGKRGDSGKWALPGGHAEVGEDAISCAIRELWEETGLHPKRIDLVGTKTMGGTVSQLHISVFRALVDGEPTNVNDPDKEFTEFRWELVPGGHFPEDIAANMHHAKDVVGPMLRRRT